MHAISPVIWFKGISAKFLSSSAFRAAAGSTSAAPCPADVACNSQALLGFRSTHSCALQASQGLQEAFTSAVKAA